MGHAWSWHAFRHFLLSRIPGSVSGFIAFPDESRREEPCNVWTFAPSMWIIARAHAGQLPTAETVGGRIVRLSVRRVDLGNDGSFK